MGLKGQKRAKTEISKQALNVKRADGFLQGDISIAAGAVTIFVFAITLITVKLLPLLRRKITRERA